MKLGSLFSGAGGLDMAVERVFGATTLWHSEIDPAASKVLAARWPDVPNLGDISAIDWSEVEPVDIIAGGWPCQPFSLAGKRKGAEDDRALWPHIARAVRMVRPRLVVLENVTAVLGPEFQRVANNLAALGYDLAWTCLRAAEVGAPHRRERLFIVATDTTRDGWHEGWPESAGLVGRSDVAERGASDVGALLPTPRTTDSHGAGEHGAGEHGAGGPDLRTAISLLQTPSVADALGGHLNRSGARRDEPLLPGQAREMGDGWGRYAAAVERWERATRPAPSPTEPNAKGNPRLNPAFSEWMMGWPPGWVTDVEGISRNDQLRIVGNGVCPQQAVAALRWLLSVEVAA